MERQVNLSEWVLQNASDSILIIDLTGIIRYCNPAACKLYQYIEEELVGEPISKLMPDEFENEFNMVREGILFNETPEPFETTRLTSKKQRVSVSVRYSPVKDDAGKVIAISSLGRVSAHNRMQGRSQALIETAPDAMVIVNQFGQIVLVNRQTGNLFGYSKEELLGKPVEILIPDRFKKEHPSHRLNFFRQPRTRSMGTNRELFGKKKSGEEFPVEVSLSPLKTEEGTFVSAAIRDITDRKKSEAKFRGLLESAPDAMVIVNQGGLIQLVNAQCVTMFGYSHHELSNKKVELLIPTRFRKKHVGHRNNFFSNARLRPMGVGLELWGRRKNGEEFPIEISLSPLETGEGVLVSAAIRDISERKKAEEVKQRALQMETRNKELEQFAYVASHDLQEPLRTISSFIGLLQKQYEGQWDEKARKYFKFITDASSSMSSLIHGLLEYSRIGRAGKQERIDCHQLMQEVTDQLKTLITEKKAKITFLHLPTVQGYRLELKSLFQNLITNAIKFSKKDESPRVTIRVKKESGYWRFSVTDNGIGIASEYFEKIFVIFQRLHLRKEYEGTGIGLAYCKKIVEMHGGKIWVESTPGSGSTFHFTLPL